MILHFSGVLLESVWEATQKNNSKKHQPYTRDEVVLRVGERINTMNFVQALEWAEDGSKTPDTVSVFH